MTLENPEIHNVILLFVLGLLFFFQRLICWVNHIIKPIHTISTRILDIR